MKNDQTRGLISHFRRAGPPALLAACLAIGPAFAQSSTTTVRTGEPTTETTKTKIKENKQGDTVVKQKTTSDDADTTVKTKSKTTVDDGSTTVKVR